MTTRLLSAVLFLCIGLGLLAQIPPRPFPRNQVNDLAEVLDDSARTAALEYRLRKLTDSANIEILAVTVKSISNQTCQEFTQELAKAWEDETESKIGIFVLIHIDGREYAIVPGSSYAAQLDPFICRKIEEQYLRPFLKSEEYYQGFNAASIAIANHLTGKLSDVELKSDDRYHLILFISLGVILVLMVSFYYLLKNLQANSFSSKPTNFTSAFLLLSKFHPSNSSYENFSKGNGIFKKEVSGSDLANFGGGSWGSW
ncbi:MAG: TPM domain-containing protein [Cytophagaceae bacterium]|jgi:uncharacterized membrane protein YgcG|nr:TPM domain-containing protein [Cytophagaceae bacterium]